jgi:hypothetical protein
MVRTQFTALPPLPSCVGICNGHGDNTLGMTMIRLFVLLFGVPPLTGQPIDSHSAFVRVSPRDHRYLELSDGTPYIPIGLNMISPPNAGRGEDEALRGMEDWIARLSSNGGNYIRVWLSNDF